MAHQIVDGPTLRLRLKAGVAAGHSMDMAIAFWGAGAAKSLGIIDGSGVRIVCDLIGGGTNPYEIEKLLGLGCNVRHLPKLHAKIGLVGEIACFVGSSNMSTNGLGLEGHATRGTLEVNVVFEGVEPTVRQEFDAIWAASARVTKKILRTAAERWVPKALTNQPADAGKGSLLAALLSDDETLRSMPCSVAYYSEMSDKEKREFAKVHQEVLEAQGTGHDLFDDWSELPTGYLISVCRTKGNPPRTDHALKDVSYCFRPLDADFHRDGRYLIVRTAKHLPGFEKLTGQDLVTFKELILEYVKHRWSDERKSRIIPIQRLMTFASERGQK